MDYCSNCGHPLPDSGKVCPNCGQKQRSQSDLAGRSELSLFVIGVAMALFSIITVIGPFILLIVYFVIKEKSPALARGLGYGLLGVLALALGAFALCWERLMRGGW